MRLSLTIRQEKGTDLVAEEKWSEARQRVNADLTRHGKEINEMTRKMSELGSQLHTKIDDLKGDVSDASGKSISCASK